VASTHSNSDLDWPAAGIAGIEHRGMCLTALGVLDF